MIKIQGPSLRKISPKAIDLYLSVTHFRSFRCTSNIILQKSTVERQSARVHGRSSSLSALAHLHLGECVYIHPRLLALRIPLERGVRRLRSPLRRPPLYRTSPPSAPPRPPLCCCRRHIKALDAG